MLRLLLSILFVVWLPFTMAAQNSLQYTRLTAEDGLSNNSVRCLLQDKSGIMWIGTNDGLNRYDGTSFIQYSILSQPALSNNIVTSLMEDEKGLIWIGTDDGLNILDPSANTIRRFVPTDAISTSLPSRSISAIQKMKDGTTLLIYGTWLAKVSGNYIISPFYLDPGLKQSDMVIVGFTEQSDSEAWVSFLDKETALVKRTGEKLSSPLLFAKDYAWIHTDMKGITWSVSGKGVNRYNANTHSFDTWITNNYAPDGRAPNLHVHTCYAVDAEGNMWLGNERNDLVRYDILQKKATDYSWLSKSINATLIYCLYRDNYNNIWAGTDNGIIKISNQPAVFNNIPFIIKGNELKNIRCRRIIADRNNTWYAGTENYGLLKKMRTKDGRDTSIALSTYGATSITDLPFPNSRLSIQLKGQYDIGYIYDMYYDNANTIWLAGYGIARYDIRTDSLEIFLAGGDQLAVNESINQFSICYDGKLFWTCGQFNLFTFDPVSRILQPFKDNKGNMPFKNMACWALVVKGDWIWAGSSKGLYKINSRTREMIKLSIHPVLEYGINDINIDGDSSFWISTAGGGIIYYNEETGAVKQYTNREGLSNNTVCGLLRDKNNDLWISTYAGLSYFNRQTNQFTNFYVKDGLNADEFNRKAFFKLKDGSLIFGGMNGYMVFNPDEAFKLDKAVSIMLTRFSKTNGSGETSESVFNIDELKKIVIDPGDKFFSFHFTLSNLYDPPANRYFYQLVGLDNAWHSLSNQPFISFNGLPPGDYTLKIKGTAGRGTSSSNEISLAIEVRQVFYKTAWFILLAVLATAAIIYFVVRYRIRQVKKIQYLRTRIASDLHDDVGSSLTRITVLADAIQREEMKERASEQLGTIAGISRGAVSTMKDVIWSIDSRNDTMGGMIQYMQEHMYNMLTPANIDYQLSQAGLTDNERLDMNFRQNVYLTFKEAINNIVKHAGATRVQVDLKKENGYFIMQIKDDGKGLNKEKTSGQGLYNMKLRADRLKARLEIASERGVTVLLKVPV